MYKDPQYPIYPTEKNRHLLDLIIGASSNPGSVVLDCFCGSGTTLKSAQLLNRKWIGIDQSEAAIKAAIARIETIRGDLAATQLTRQTTASVDRIATSKH